MTNDRREISRKLRILQHAEKAGSVRPALELAGRQRKI